MKKTVLLLCCLSICALYAQPITDIGQGFEKHCFHAPWDRLSNSNRFCCHSTADRFFFSFEVTDSTLTLTEPFRNESDVEPEDRIELFFSPTAEMQEYYCAEIDAKGRVLDYKANYYRKLDYSWNFSSLEIHSHLTPWGYRVGGSILRSELEKLGLNLTEGFWMGVFQDDFRPDGSVHWYSLIPTKDSVPDFHKPDVLFKCRMTPKTEYRGLVVYPNDITSTGLEEWEKRIQKSGVNLIGLHAATSNDPIDTLEAFVKSKMGRQFLKMCRRLNVDVEYEVHALMFLLPRTLFGEHPEYFRMDTNGQRTEKYNMCFTNPEAVEAIRPQIKAMLRWMKPTTHRYFFWPDDKKHMYCHCEHCRELTPSEQSLTYENQLLDIIRCYDRKASLAHLAYHQTQTAPLKVKAKEGIFLEYAPIFRDYSTLLAPEMEQTLTDNLLAFPAFSQHILEYWLDESMQAKWKRNALVPLVYDLEDGTRDVQHYRELGAASITCFATWLNGLYIKLFGNTDSIFIHYGQSFSR